MTMVSGLFTFGYLKKCNILVRGRAGIKGLFRGIGKERMYWVSLSLTDAEMPEMDGYRLTAEVRKDPALKDLYVVLHTSLSGSFNKAMVGKVGCNDFLSKFQPDELAEVVQKRLRQIFNKE